MPDHDPTLADAEWKKIQQRTFTRWCNEHLKVANIVIYDLETDLCDGIKLIVLLEILAHKRVGKYNKKPNFKSQKVENVDIALKFIKNENIRLVNNNVSDIVKGNLKIILGLIWRLIAKYQISMPMGNYKFDDDDGKGGKKKDSRMTPKQVLLAWVKRKMPPEIPMNNFTTDWNDGRAIAALVDAVEPGLFPDVDPKYLDPNDAVNNAKKAMNTADKYLGVPPVLDAADMCNPKVDEMSVMTYVSYFPKAKCKPGAPHRPQLPAAAKYSAEGPGITPEGLVAKQPVPFTVFTAGAGKGTPQVNVFGPERSNITCEVVDNGDKTSSCNYTPPEQDRTPSFSSDLYQDRRMVKRNKKQKSRSTLCLLVFLGCAIMFFALVLIYSSFAINNDEDFDFDNDQLEARIQSQFNYNQYWAGVPFFVIGTLVLFSGIFQRSRRLTMTSVIFCVVSVALTLFVLALDSANFFYWNSLERSKSYWDSKSGYSCGTDNASKACTCLNSSSSQTISVYGCNIVRKLSALYGAVVTSAIMVTLFSMAAITVLIESLS